MDGDGGGKTAAAVTTGARVTMAAGAGSSVTAPDLAWTRTGKGERRRGRYPWWRRMVGRQRLGSQGATMKPGRQPYTADIRSVCEALVASDLFFVFFRGEKYALQFLLVVFGSPMGNAQMCISAGVPFFPCFFVRVFFRRHRTFGEETAPLSICRRVFRVCVGGLEFGSRFSASAGERIILGG